jgi:hypothetical protein
MGTGPRLGPRARPRLRAARVAPRCQMRARWALSRAAKGAGGRGDAGLSLGGHTSPLFGAQSGGAKPPPPSGEGEGGEGVVKCTHRAVLQNAAPPARPASEPTARPRHGRTRAGGARRRQSGSLALRDAAGRREGECTAVVFWCVFLCAWLATHGDAAGGGAASTGRRGLTPAWVGGGRGGAGAGGRPLRRRGRGAGRPRGPAAATRAPAGLGLWQQLSSSETGQRGLAGRTRPCAVHGGRRRRGAPMPRGAGAGH